MNTNRRHMRIPSIGHAVQDDASKTTFSRAWLVTFTDLISLLLTFFVLLFSMSNVSADKWAYLSTTLSRSLKPVVVEQQPSPMTHQFNIPTIIEPDATNLDYLSTVFEELMSKDEVLAKSMVTRLDDRLIIGLPGDVMFEPSIAEITETAQQAVFALSSILRNIDNQIGVNGYASSFAGQASEKAQFTSDWELSIARAAAVANYLRRSGVSQNITAYGFANTRYTVQTDRPAVDHSAADRVDIVIFPSASKQ